MGCPELTYRPTLKVLARTEKSGCSRKDKYRTDAYLYKYNGKEWQDELGLNMYAMDMRMYDPALARWVVQDPIVHFNQSPYSSFDGNPVFWVDPSGATTENNNSGSTGVSLVGGISLDSVMATSAVNFTSYADSYTTKESISWSIWSSMINDSDEEILPSDCIKSEVLGSSSKNYTKYKSVSYEGSGLSFPNIFTSFMDTALGGYRSLTSTESGRNYYYNLHNSPLSKSIDNAVMGTIVSVGMAPLALEYGSIVLLKYGADVTMQYLMKGNVDFLAAGSNASLPIAIAPLVTQMPNLTKGLIGGDSKSLTSSVLKVGTGYIGNGLGRAASFTSLGNSGSAILQSFHDNLQSSTIDFNMYK